MNVAKAGNSSNQIQQLIQSFVETQLSLYGWKRRSLDVGFNHLLGSLTLIGAIR